ncbi:Histone deacetylase complex subunit, partial [Coemansia sp. RSA 1933]
HISIHSMLLLEAPPSLEPTGIDRRSSYLSLNNRACRRREASYLCAHASKSAGVDALLSGRRTEHPVTRCVVSNPEKSTGSCCTSGRRRASDPGNTLPSRAIRFNQQCLRTASLESSNNNRDVKESKIANSDSNSSSNEAGAVNNDSGYAEDQQPDSYDLKEEENENDEDQSDEEDEDEEEDEEEGDDGVVRCVCGERNDGELMIQCEICQVWQHTLCMGIRDEAHIPDKYYCEKCRPEDHPYINSRPRTLVLAEASAMGTSSMMRRSAVMAVAKMSAREEYRSAAAAAAIAASVAASSAGGRSGTTNGNSGRKTPKKSTRKPDGGASAATPRSAARRNNKSRRQSQRGGVDDLAAENSDSEYTRGSRGADSFRLGAGASASYGDDANGYEDDDDGSNGSRAGHGRARRNQTPKRISANGNRRRKTSAQSPAASSRSGNSNSAGDQIDGNAGSDLDDAGFGDGADAQYAQEDVVARMMGAKINDSTPRGSRANKVRTPKARNRSISTIVKPNADSRGFVMGSPSRKPLKHEYSAAANGAKRRGKSAPGSPRLDSRSPSPALQSILYDDDDGDDGEGAKNDRSSKRRRTGGGGSSRGNAGKHNNRMAVSATNSPYLGNGSMFGPFGEGPERHRGRTESGSAAAFADDKGKSSVELDAFESEGAYDYGKVGGGTDYSANEDHPDDSQQHGHGSRQPKHKFPPLETTDIDGNTVTIPSHLLNNHGQPMYSSADSETMCKIRYPHNKTSVGELNRRAKQLLEWLGKMQSEYEHEAASIVEPLEAKDMGIAQKTMSIGDRVGSDHVSEAPTSPIDPADWPDEEGYDGEGHGAKDSNSAPKQPRSTLSIMEDLVWRLIRFQETYSN